MKVAAFINIPEDSYKANFIYQKLQMLGIQQGVDVVIEVENYENGTIISKEELSESQLVIIVSDTNYLRDEFENIPVVQITSEKTMKNGELICDIFYDAIKREKQVLVR